MPDANLVNPLFYYRLDNFYSNHRKYAQSKSYAQLMGAVKQADSKCAPVQTVADLLDWWGDSALIPENLRMDAFSSEANPCGLIAKYRFSDEFYSVRERETGL